MSDILIAQPVFLVASERSGSTLLRLMLDSHPSIANPGECDFLFDQVKDDGSQPNVDQYREWLALDRIFLGRKLTIDPSLGFVDLINSFVSQMKRPNSVMVMNIHRNFYRIPQYFPQARYIHLIRDGRDVARSCIGMDWVGNTYYGIDIWLEAETAWDSLKASLQPSQYMEIRYEDILENIESGLGRICKFLGTEYSQRMLDYTTHSTYSLPDKNLCYQWKSKYNERELSLVESKASDVLAKYGYELSGVSICGPSLFERVSLFVQNKLFRIRRRISVYGYSLFFQYVLAKRLKISPWERALIARINAVNAKLIK